jgi:hypothetical protein
VGEAEADVWRGFRHLEMVLACDQVSSEPRSNG